MDLELKPRSRIKEFLSNLHSKLEDLLFLLIRKTPQAIIPKSIMTWFENYLDKRTQELQQEIIRQQWKQIYLEKAMEEIQATRQVKEAQSED